MLVGGEGSLTPDRKEDFIAKSLDLLDAPSNRLGRGRRRVVQNETVSNMRRMAGEDDTVVVVVGRFRTLMDMLHSLGILGKGLVEEAFELSYQLWAFLPP
jgi:hypothetical protein